MTDEQRKTYKRAGGGFPSDVTDAEWAVLGPLIPDAIPGGRSRKTDMRLAINAPLCLLRTGCPRRYLPRDAFPPRSTVYNIFRKFQADGTWHAIWDGLYPMLREREDREGSRSAGISYEPGKKVKGRKIHSLSDTLDLPICLVVHSAGVQDRDGAALLFDKIKLRFP